MTKRAVRWDDDGQRSRHATAGPLRIASLWLMALAWSACDTGPAPPRVATQHLVALPSIVVEGDPNAPEQAQALAPDRAPTDPPRFERIGNEARPVLRGIPLAWPRRQIGAPLDTNPQVLASTFSLPSEFAPYGSALLTVGALADGVWSAAPAQRAPITRVGEQPQVEVRFPLERLPAADPERDSAWLRAQIRALPGGRYRRIETAPQRIPAQARLDLGFGILAEAHEQGPVQFRLSSCVAGECTPLVDETLDPAQPEARQWRDHSLSLAALAGRDVGFRFETVHTGKGAFTLPVWSDPVLLAPGDALAAPRNLVLISLDTLRADRLPSYDYPRDTAPFIEARLARQGVVFEHAFSAASTTGPSHMTAFTARTPSAHGLRDNIVKSHLSPEILTLAEQLRAAGFATGAVTEDGALAIGSGVERGFESYREFHPDGELPHRAETTFGAGRAWIDRHPDRRFLLFVQTYQTHTPYRAPDDTPPLSGPPPTLAGEHAGLRLRKDWQPEAYDREIRYVDQAVRGFVEGLDAAGILDDTLVVLFSDHGEAFLEHGYLHHGGGIHEEVLHVPLIIAGPGIAAGRRVSAPVGLVDLLPSLLELLGLPPDPGAMGRSFAGLVRGEDADPSWWERPIFSESWAPRRVELVEGKIRKVERRPPTLAVRRGTRKLIREPGPDGDRYAYYDLATDPDERVDLFAAQPEQAADLRALLDGYLAETALPASTPDDDLDPAHQAALRALGYLE